MADIRAEDLTQETKATLDGSEQFIMFDSTEGKRGTVSAVGDYILQNGDASGSGDTVADLVDGKQDKLTSGTNIKTVNGNSLLGSGNVSIQSGDTVTVTQTQTAGNEIASVSVNGTPTKLYAPAETDPVFGASPAAGITAADITSWDGKQAALVSGTNIKTVNGNSLLGSGNITIEGGGGGGDTVSYTPTQTSGNELGTISINGNGQKIYSPTETDPVFAASAAHGITSANITSWNNKQDALVSGTNIKTVNGNSLLGSGDLTIQGGSDVDVTQVSITVANWNATTTCTKSVTGVTASNSIIVSPAPASIADYVSAGVYCSAQANGTLTFECTSTPTADLVVNVMIVG